MPIFADEKCSPIATNKDGTPVVDDASINPSLTIKGGFLFPHNRPQLDPKKTSAAFKKEEARLKLLGFVNISHQGPEENHQQTPWGDNFKVAKPIRLLIVDETSNTASNQRFLKSLETNKQKLMKLYALSNSEYNRIAIMAYGVLGKETEFGDGWTYQGEKLCSFLCEYFRPAIASVYYGVKRGDFSVDLDTEMSSGLTQLRKVPLEIVREFSITKQDLHDPAKAAIATAGFLARLLREMKTKVRNSANTPEKKLSYMNKGNIFDFLGYLYGGIRCRLYQTPQPRPYKLPYTKKINEHIKKIALYIEQENFQLY